MFKDEKIERTKPSNRILVTVNKSKNREEIRRHLFFVYSIVYPLTRKSLHHVHPEGKGRGAHSTQPAKTSVSPRSSSLRTFRAEEKRMFSQATLNNVFAGRLRSGVQPLRREISLPFLDNPKVRFRFLLVRLTYVRQLRLASVPLTRSTCSKCRPFHILPTDLPTLSYN